MPELPEVETMARDLEPLIVGATITDAWCDWPTIIRHPDSETFRQDIVGRRVLGVGRRAKWVIVSLSEGRVLTIQPKMTGQLFVVPAHQSGMSSGQLFVLPAETPHDRHVHVRLGLDGGPVAGGALTEGPRWLLYRDVRKFGRLGLYRQEEQGAILGADDIGELFGAFGPEPLDDAFTVRAFRRLLRRRRGRLKTTITDQGFIAGVGNIYADEALWRARLHPLRSVGTLRPPDERRLYDAIRAVLREAIDRRGSSVDDYTAPEGDGEMQEHLDVYQRTGLPCRRCGRPIRRLVLGQRGTHFCSWCQRLPAADRHGTNAVLAARARRSTRPVQRGRTWSELGGPQPTD